MYFREDYCLKFSEVWTNSMKFETKGFPKKILSVAKTTTIRKLEWNTCRNFVNLRTGDSFVNRCRRKIYTIWKYHQNIQQNIYNEYIYMQGLQNVMHTVIILGFCGIIPSRSRIVLGNMVEPVNEGMCVCWNDCLGVDGEVKVRRELVKIIFWLVWRFCGLERVFTF